MKKHKGFTLIELMITILVVAILASIAIPSYREYVIRGNRTAAQAAMMDVAAQQQQYFVANRAYADLDELGYSLPSEVDDHYDLGIDVVNDPDDPPPRFTINLTATGPQASDGNLSLTSEGVRSPDGKW